MADLQALPDDVLNTIQCSLDKSKKKKHIAKDPVLLLACGHVACRNCVLSNKDKGKFQCYYTDCNKEQTLNNDAVSLISVKPTEMLIKSNLKELYKMLQEDMENQYEIFDEQELEDCIDQKFDVMGDEMRLRVDSLKAQIDLYEEKFLKRLREIKVKLKASIPSKEIKEKKERFDEIQSKPEKTKEGFYECQDALLDIQNKIEQSSSIPSTVFFDPCELDLDMSFIGKLGSFLSDQPSLPMRLRLNKPKVESVEVADAVYRLCILPNSTLCASFSKSNKLGIYSKDFKLIKMIDQIGNLKFNNPRGVAADTENKVVVCDSYNSRLILTDLEFKNAKAVGKLGSGPYEFNAPYDACFNDKHIYVCDCQNFRIQKFTDELEFVQVYVIGYCPFQIRVLDNTICVRDFDDRIFFYDKESFKEKKEEKKEKNNDNNETKKGIISTLDDRKSFIQLDFKLEEINFYSSSGKLELTSKANYSDYKNCDMCVFNGNLVITGNANRLLII